MKALDERSYFFDGGIRFECRRCGTCCTGDAGVVEVDEQEIAGISAYLDMSVSQLADAFLCPWEKGYRIKEARDGRCLFFDDGCRIYPVRPLQCRTFPFWVATLRSEARWNDIRKRCPGIGSGRRYTKSDILDILSHSFGTPL